MPGKYADIRIRIYPWDEARKAYPLEATLDDGSFFDGGELRIDLEKLRAAQLDAEGYGMELFDALFAGKIRRAYDKATGRAEAEAEGQMRVCLWIDDGAAELHAFPWERLYHIHKGNQVPLATSALFMRLRTGQRFVADPVLMALQAIHADPNGYDRDKENLPLPMEVRHLVGNIDPGDLQRLGQEFGSSLDVVEATLTIFSKRGQREPAGHDQPGAFVLLIGGHGTAKSTELRHIASITAEQSLRPNAEQQVIPVFVNLRDYLKLRAGSRSYLKKLHWETSARLQLGMDCLSRMQPTCAVWP